MLAKCIIPCLDIKDGRVVKGIQYVNLKDACDSVERVQVYDAKRADELDMGVRRALWRRGY